VTTGLVACLRAGSPRISRGVRARGSPSMRRSSRARPSSSPVCCVIYAGGMSPERCGRPPRDELSLARLPPQCTSTGVTRLADPASSAAVREIPVIAPVPLPCVARPSRPDMEQGNVGLDEDGGSSCRQSARA